jgi:CubicO group peptidase (beta-lactamase class C family)
MSMLSGTVAPGYEPVREAFRANFAQRAEIGAAVSVFRHGREVIRLWGGLAAPDTGLPWREDTLQVIFSCTKSVPLREAVSRQPVMTATTAAGHDTEPDHASR